jgi:hypothetical protein
LYLFCLDVIFDAMANRNDTAPLSHDQLRYETALRIIGLFDRGEVSMTAIEKFLREHDRLRDEKNDG